MTLAPTITRFEDIARRITYPGLLIQVGFDGWKSPPEEGPNYFLRVLCLDGACNVTGEPLEWKGRKWRLSSHMTDGEVVWTAFKAILTALEHEAREKFLFDGVPVADSHVDIHALVQLHKTHQPVSRHDARSSASPAGTPPAPAVRLTPAGSHSGDGRLQEAVLVPGDAPLDPCTTGLAI